MKAVVFIGGINQHNQPRGGEEAKNQKLVKYLKSLNRPCHSIDTHNWKRRFVRVCLSLGIYVLGQRQKKIIISASDESAYKLLKLLKLFRVLRRNEVHYFVIGGDFARQLAKHQHRLSIYKALTGIYPESRAMVEEAKALGLPNLRHVPNFREVPPPVLKTQLTEEGIIHFIYLARITPDKGSDLLLEACEYLNKKGFASKYKVDFYGFFHPDPDQYQERFSARLMQSTNVTYKGFLDVNTIAGFQALFYYDVLLFPTYWATEGYSGTLIDALSAGIPAIASDWNYNSELVQDNYNGKLIAPKNAQALAKAMQTMITEPDCVLELSAKAFESAKAFDIKDLLGQTVFAND